MSDMNTIIFIVINLFTIMIFLIEFYLFKYSKNIFKDEKNAFIFFLIFIILLYSIQIMSVSLLGINEKIFKPRNFIHFPFNVSLLNTSF